MTDRPPLRCEQVSADLLTGPTDDVQSRRIATHLATCANCRTLSRTLDRDRARLGRHLDTAEWLPVANRVFAALPDRGTRRTDRTATASRTTSTLNPFVPAGAGSPRHTAAGPRPLATTLRAACLLIVGLGLGLAVQQVWPRADGDRATEATELAGTSRQDGALGAQPGAGGIDRTGRDGNSAYVPAPGDNPPLIVPGGTVGITANQNRETWRSVRHAVQDGISPLLYPPVPPGTFDSVVIDTMTTDSFAVRYAAEDMDILMTAGSPAGAATVQSDTGYQATVRGTPAAVTVTQTTVPGQGGLRLDGQTSSALAPGTVVEVTWTEAGLLRDPASGASTAALPYRVTAAGLPVDVVMTFVDSLVPFGNGWDELREDLPMGTAFVTPGTMPDGFGAASLIDQSVTGSAKGVAISYVVAYQRVAGGTLDRIVFSAAPADATDDDTGAGDLTAAGHPATRADTPAAMGRPATRTVTWRVGTIRYRVDFNGDGITDAEIDRVLSGLAETAVARPTTTGPSASFPLGQAA